MVWNQTACVTEDSVVFIRYARQLGGEEWDSRPKELDWDHQQQLAPWLYDLSEGNRSLQLLAQYDQHPGYPFLILCIHQWLGSSLAEHPIQQWIQSAQLVNVVSGCLLTIAVLLLMRHWQGPIAGFISGMLTALLPGLIHLRADALSDTASLTCMMFSVYFAVRFFDSSRWYDAIAVGLFQGVGYLIRPEMLGIWAITGFYLSMWTWRCPQIRSQFLVYLCSFALLAGPYMVIRGTVLTKNVRPPTPATALPADWDAMPIRLSEADEVRKKPWPIRYLLGVRRVLGNMARNLPTGVWFLAVVGFGTFLRRSRWHRSDWLLLSLFGMFLVLLPGHFARKGYLEQRHVLLLSLLATAMIWPGIQLLHHRLGCSRRIMVLFLLILSAWQGSQLLTKPLHMERIGYVTAAKWLQEQIPADGVLLDPAGLTSLYAGRDENNRWIAASPSQFWERIYQLRLRYPSPVWMILSTRELEPDELTEVIHRSAPESVVTPLVEIPQTLDQPNSYRIIVYRIDYWEEDAP